MISTTKASEEREVVRETREVSKMKNKNAILVGSLNSWSVSTNQTRNFTTSSKPSKKSLLKHTEKKQTKNRKHSLQQPENKQTNKQKNNNPDGWPQEVHNHINTVTFLIT